MSLPPLSIPQVRLLASITPSDMPMPPQSHPAGPGTFASTVAQLSEQSVLSIGEEIRVQGTIVGARCIVIAGAFDSEHLTTTELVITRTGVYRGEAEVALAELDGRFEGALTVNGHLAALTNCQFVGSAQYERLSVQPGGTLNGEFAVLPKPAL